MRSTLVADTSVIYAALDPSERDHAVCTELLASAPCVAIPATVIVELDWLSQARGCADAVDRLLASVIGGSLIVVNLDHEDYIRVRELVARYASLHLGVVDASVVAIAERMEQDTIATLDRRHFSVVRPLHVESFTLVP